MAIPTTLDTFVTDELIFEPQLVIEKRTMSPAIYVRVTERRSGRVVETQVFESNEEYRAFVERKARGG